MRVKKMMKLKKKIQNDMKFKRLALSGEITFHPCVRFHSPIAKKLLDQRNKNERFSMKF